MLHGLMGCPSRILCALCGLGANRFIFSRLRFQEMIPKSRGARFLRCDVILLHWVAPENPD